MRAPVQHLRTPDSAEVSAAQARVRADPINTLAAVQTRPRCALILLNCAVLAGVSGCASASICPRSRFGGSAVAAVLARQRGAVAHRGLRLRLRLRFCLPLQALDPAQPGRALQPGECQQQHHQQEADSKEAAPQLVPELLLLILAHRTWVRVGVDSVGLGAGPPARAWPSGVAASRAAAPSRGSSRSPSGIQPRRGRLRLSPSGAARCRPCPQAVPRLFWSRPLDRLRKSPAEAAGASAAVTLRSLQACRPWPGPRPAAAAGYAASHPCPSPRRQPTVTMA